MIKQESKLEFGAKIVRWFEANKRDLPFRKDRDPYKVWLSEILLQQTQMATGIKYYNKFIKKFAGLCSFRMKHINIEFCLVKTKNDILKCKVLFKSSIIPQ